MSLMKRLAQAGVLAGLAAGCAGPWLQALGLGPPGGRVPFVETYAGTTQGHEDGTSISAKLTYPWGLAIDSKGALFVSSETGDHAIRMISPDGQVSTFAGDLAGYADGPVKEARFRAPRGMAIDASGNVYVADLGNHRIRKISADGHVSTLAGSTQGSADGSGASAQFSAPEDVVLDSRGDLLVADTGNNAIRRIRLSDAPTVSTVAGGPAGFVDGDPAMARFSLPRGLTLAPDGTLYVADFGNGAVRKVDSSGNVSTVARVGGPFSAILAAGAMMETTLAPLDLTVGKDGAIYCAVGMRVCRVGPDGTVTTIAGIAQDEVRADSEAALRRSVDGPGLEARFGYASAIEAGPDGSLYVTDGVNHLIRRIRL